MKLGLHTADFTRPGGAPRLGPQVDAPGMIETLRTQVMPAIEAL